MGEKQFLLLQLNKQMENWIYWSFWPLGRTFDVKKYQYWL